MLCFEKIERCTAQGAAKDLCEAAQKGLRALHLSFGRRLEVREDASAPKYVNMQFAIHRVSENVPPLGSKTSFPT